MGEEMNNLMLFADGKPVGFVASSDVEIKTKEGDTPEDFSPKAYSLSISFSVDKKDASTLLWRELLATRTLSRKERKRLIRCVEHYGKVEFTMKDMEVQADGIGSGKLTLVCTTPAQVKCFLRMKDAGDFTYKTVRKL